MRGFGPGTLALKQVRPARQTLGTKTGLALGSRGFVPGLTFCSSSGCRPSSRGGTRPSSAESSFPSSRRSEHVRAILRPRRQAGARPGVDRLGRRRRRSSRASRTLRRSPLGHCRFAPAAPSRRCARSAAHAALRPGRRRQEAPASQWLASRGTRSAWASLAHATMGSGRSPATWSRRRIQRPWNPGGNPNHAGRPTFRRSAHRPRAADELEAPQTPIMIVIDDDHLIGPPQIHRLVAGLCAQHPPSSASFSRPAMIHRSRLRSSAATHRSPSCARAIFAHHRGDIRSSASVLGRPVPDAVHARSSSALKGGRRACALARGDAPRRRLADDC